MLAAALNYRGRVEDKDWGSVFIRQFDEFKLIRLAPYEEIEKVRLQLCQPEDYEELAQHIQKKWDAAEICLEMRGPKVKLLRAVRQMLFFDQEKRYDRVLLEGCDGVKDFPWALQIMVIQLPAAEAELDPESMEGADILILNDSPETESRGFIAGIRKDHPDIPVFAEKMGGGFSPELKAGLEALFNTYMEKRERIKAMLAEKLSEPSISCAQACSMAGELQVSSFLFGNVCDECGYSITHCGLSCF